MDRVCISIQRYPDRSCVCLFESGVERIVIRSLAMDPPVVWSGSYSRMSVQSKGSHVQMEVIGITFSRNASLVLTAPSNESASPRVVVDGCNFVSAMDIRPLRIISGGHILVNRSNFVGNLNGGAGEIQGFLSLSLPLSLFFFLPFCLFVACLVVW